MDKHYLYDDVKNLKYWVHAILPLVYDDSLSYYEVLAKVSAKMNEVIEQLNKNSEQIDKVTEFTVTSIENLTQAFNNFQAAMLERQDNFEKKLLKDVADWEEQLMADIDEWEKQLKSEIDEWEKTLKNEINTWETNFTETYNTWKNQLESDIAEWERQLKADNDKWKADTTDELNTWKSDTESALNEWKNETMQSLETWKSNTESDINSWKQEAESDIASWKEQAEQGLNTWKQQAQADITKWENDFQSKYDSWKSEFESTYNSWQSAFEEKYNTWQSTFEASYTEWKNGVDSDLAAWKTQAEKDIQTWESNTVNDLNTWKENFQGEQANWEADVQQDIEQKFEQLGEVYVAKADVVQTTGENENFVMSQKAVTDELGKKANSTDVTNLSNRVDNISSELADDYVPKSDVVQATGQSTTQVMSQKAVTDELGKKANSSDVTSLSNRVDNISSELAGDYVPKSDVVQATGQSTTQVMSQKAVTDELNNKASAVAISQQDTLPTISGVNTYENNQYVPFNGIPNSNYSGVLYFHNSPNDGYGAEIIVPYTTGTEHGVWYDTIKKNVRQPALKLADTNDLNKKANTYKFDDSLQSQSGIYYRYGGSTLFNNIPHSGSATVIQSVNYDTEGYGVELIIPQSGGNAYGVWYDAIRGDINGRTAAIRLAEQPDLDKANTAITSLQNTLSTTQQQVNGLNNGVDSFVLKSTNITSRPDFSKGLQVTFNGFTSSRPADLPALPDTPTLYSANDFSNTLLSIPTMTNVVPTSGFLGTQFLLTNKREILTRQCEYDNDGNPTSISEWETSNPFVSKMFTQGQLTSNTFANLVTYGAGVYTLSNVDMNSFTDKPSDMIATDKDAMVVVIPYSYTGTNPKYYNNFWLYLMFNDHPQYVYKRYIHKGAYNAQPSATGVWYKSTSEIVR